MDCARQIAYCRLSSCLHLHASGPCWPSLASEASIVTGLACAAGTQGRVYRGTLEGERVAVKIVDNASTLRTIGAQRP